ncbi:transglutaminase [Oceanicola sp. 22II-s10i]|uniref:transglutaminase family protein n=1 Tax=Oceanicola sp. 22II-s10i TaxID=1317116 RepID=UPI000B522AB3|nr:transglutaminase family protein [Oceanicola sp. 22II-s10i]OWU83337.1 transglutaminase [Oceanicola sp. 22II-s10i]
MRLRISHKTVYTYDRPVHYALQQVRLTPRDAVGQKVLSWNSTITGGSKQCTFDDEFRNHVDLVLMEDAERLEIVSEGEVEVEDRAGVIGMGKSFAPLWLFLHKTPATTPGAQIRKLAKSVEKDLAENQLSAMHALSAAVAEAVAYEKGTTGASTTAEEAVTAGTGVCQDHAHVMISAARHLNRPARYVSGYLMMDGVDTQEASHAWCEVWVDGLGWVGFDVSNAMCPDDRYVRVAIGRDYADAAPVHGIWQGEAKEELCVSLQVQQ